MHKANEQIVCLINNYIHVFDAEMIMRVDEHNFVVEKTEDYFAYNITGKLIDRKKGIVQLGSMFFTVGGHMPGDINDGEFISFHCGRLDID